VTSAATAGRAILLAILAWWTWRFVSHPLDWEVMNASFLHLVNLPFHEAGHYVFLPLGEFMTILGGSLLQVIIPIVCAVAFARREDWFGMAVGIWWAGESLVDVAPYIADARALQMPLLGGGTGAEVEGHDWEAILGRLGWLHLDHTLGMSAHVAGSAIMVASLALGVWLLLGSSRAERVEA
jgi:hypothetical protein